MPGGTRAGGRHVHAVAAGGGRGVGRDARGPGNRRGGADLRVGYRRRRPDAARTARQPGRRGRPAAAGDDGVQDPGASGWAIRAAHRFRKRARGGRAVAGGGAHGPAAGGGRVGGGLRPWRLRASGASLTACGCSGKRSGGVGPASSGRDTGPGRAPDHAESRRSNPLRRLRRHAGTTVAHSRRALARAGCRGDPGRRRCRTGRARRRRRAFHVGRDQPAGHRGAPRYLRRR